jgi:hypothetical protein
MAVFRLRTKPLPSKLAKQIPDAFCPPLDEYDKLPDDFRWGAPIRNDNRQRGLRFGRRLFSVCSFPRRIDSSNKAPEVPHFTHVAY